MDIIKFEKTLQIISESNSFPSLSLSTRRLSQNRLEILWDGYHCEFEGNIGDSFMEFTCGNKSFIVPIYISMNWLDIGNILELVRSTKSFDELLQKSLSDRINKSYFWAENECKKLLRSLDVDFSFKEFSDHPNDNGLDISIGRANSCLVYEDFWDCDNTADGKKTVNVITCLDENSMDNVSLDFNHPDLALERLRLHIADVRRHELVKQMLLSIINFKEGRKNMITPSRWFALPIIDFKEEMKNTDTDITYSSLSNSSLSINTNGVKYILTIGNYNGSDKDTFWLSVSQDGTSKAMCIELYNQMLMFNMDEVDSLVKSLLMGLVWSRKSFDEMLGEISRFTNTPWRAMSLCRSVLREKGIGDIIYSNDSIVFSVNGRECELYLHGWNCDVWDESQKKCLYIECSKNVSVIDFSDGFEKGINEFKSYLMDVR